MKTSYPELLVVLTRVTDSEGYPHFVEAQVTDAYGKTWSFIDKLPIFTSRDEPVFPCVGRLSCTISDEVDDSVKGRLFLISTEKPFGVCTEAGEPASLWVLEEQLLSTDYPSLERQQASAGAAFSPTHTLFDKITSPKDSADDS